LPPAPPPREVEFFLSTRGDLGFNTGIDDSPGDVTVNRANARLGAGIPIGERGQLGLGYQYELSDYAFDNATGIIPGTDDPWGTVHRHSIGVRYGQRQTLRASWIVGGTLNWAAEDGGDLGNSLTGGGFAAFRYALTESITGGLGIQYMTRLEDDDIILPYPTFAWQISEQWELTTEREQARGVGAALIYKPTPQWVFELAGGYEPRDFRLDEQGPLPDGVVSDTAFPFSVAATYAPSGNMAITGEIGALLWRSFEVMDSGGNEISEPDVDAAPFISLRLSYKF
jgi:hypothetical protein